MSFQNEFALICDSAQEKKDAIDAERNDTLCRRICELLTAAVQNGEESDELLNRRAVELADEAESAICDAECDERCGEHAAHILALVTEAAEQGKVACVGVKDDKLVIAK